MKERTYEDLLEAMQFVEEVLERFVREDEASEKRHMDAALRYARDSDDRKMRQAVNAADRAGGSARAYKSALALLDYQLNRFEEEE